MKYTHITKAERLELEILAGKGYGVREIARAMGRSPGSISREVARNHRKPSGRWKLPGGGYEAKLAHHKAYVRRQSSTYQGKHIAEDSELLHHIVQGLKKGRSPDVISGRMKRDGESFFASKTAIYDFLYSAAGQKYCHLLPSKQYSKKRHKGAKGERVMIPNRVGIEERPVSVDKREEYGHFEADTIVSGRRHHSTAALSVLTERKARYIKLRKLESLKPKEYAKRLIHMTRNLTELKSCTFDNGIENRAHLTFAEKHQLQTYFCDPYAAWQKGAVEHQNQLLRRFIPKGSNLADYTYQQIQGIENFWNQMPRKILGYATPEEVMREQGLLLPLTKKLAKEASLAIINEESGVALRG